MATTTTPTTTPKRITERKSYQRFKAFADKVPDDKVEELLTAAHTLLESFSAYGSMSASALARETIHWVIAERKGKTVNPTPTGWGGLVQDRFGVYHCEHCCGSRESYTDENGVFHPEDDPDYEPEEEPEEDD